MFEGNIDDYLDRRRRDQEDMSARVATKEAPVETGAGKTAEVPQARDKKALRRQKALIREQMSGKLKPLKQQVRKSEEQIGVLESRKQELETLMADPDLYKDQPRWSETSREYSTVERRLERHYKLWEEAQGQIEVIEASSPG